MMMRPTLAVAFMYFVVGNKKLFLILGILPDWFCPGSYSWKNGAILFHFYSGIVLIIKLEICKFQCCGSYLCMFCMVLFSGRMMWQGPHVKYKRPEDRKYSMWIKDSKDNHFLRERGMRCLADHEIGTHFVSL